MGTHWAAGLLMKEESETQSRGKGENYFSKSRFSLASMSM